MNFEKNAFYSLVCEIEYFFAFSVLKKLTENGKIPVETGRTANVAVAEQYGVLAYPI